MKIEVFDIYQIEDVEFKICKMGKFLGLNYIKLIICNNKGKREGYLQLNSLSDEVMKEYNFGDKFKLIRIEE